MVMTRTTKMRRLIDDPNGKRIIFIVAIPDIKISSKNYYFDGRTYEILRQA